MNKINHEINTDQQHIMPPNPWLLAWKSVRKYALTSLLPLLANHSLAFAATTTPITNEVQPAVWANEAIVATYTLDHEHLIEQEKALAKYFTSSGWIDYSQAMQASNLPQQIKTHAYVVTAVATLPPTLKSMPNGEWEATMPILVLYKNPAYSQKQDLNIVLKFVESSTQGVRGFAIKSLKSTIISPPCKCAKKDQGATIV